MEQFDTMAEDLFDECRQKLLFAGYETLTTQLEEYMNNLEIVCRIDANYSKITSYRHFLSETAILIAPNFTSHCGVRAAHGPAVGSTALVKTNGIDVVRLDKVARPLQSGEPARLYS